ncbi:hypothetical protein HMPREF9442_00998 [Paraprevotella xylaniphila YIT 11841]|uniref:Uncharacterized protein n=1 Tax=Paraprevotella xylaniphila YIT 11841 TaxID=762982 RepID=F3QS43_9BACT|nr:hypothetical protein HMPREF9442_00998 [Paraprevotella xylaniphila YIT 11841]
MRKTFAALSGHCVIRFFTISVSVLWEKRGVCPFPNAADSPLARRYADVGAVACGEKKCFLLRTEKSLASFFLKNAVIG